MARDQTKVRLTVVASLSLVWEMHKIILFFFAIFISQKSFAEESINKPVEKADSSISGQVVENSETALPVEAVPSPVEEEKRDKFNLTYYEPMYFIFGNPTSKVNFSFKYQGIRDFPLYLGYVQRIFWLLRDESKPFKDANFNPRIFYRLSFDKNDEEDYLDLIPFEHNSNGKGEPDSRSYNGAGAKINWRAEYENWSFKSYFKGLYRYSLDRTNHDYEQYVGPFEMGFAISQFSYHWIDRGELTYRVYTGGEWGQKFDRTSHEVGLSFRIFGSRLTPAFYVQYFNGYSESLLNYNKREENFRVGFIL